MCGECRESLLSDVLCESCHIYWRNGFQIPGVTLVLDKMGFISDFAKDSVSSLRGRLVHRALALFGVDRLDWTTVDERLLGWILSGVKFYESLKVKPIAIETPDIHPAYLYGYCLDGFGESTQGDILWDFKTGKAAKVAARLQTAAYLDPIQRKYLRTNVKRVVVELDKDGGSPNLKWYNNRTDFNEWLSVLNTFRLLEEANGKSGVR